MRPDVVAMLVSAEGSLAVCQRLAQLGSGEESNLKVGLQLTIRTLHFALEALQPPDSRSAAEVLAGVAPFQGGRFRK